MTSCLKDRVISLCSNRLVKIESLKTKSFAGGFRAASCFVGFCFEHHRSRAGDSAVLSYAPEVHDHQHGSDDWNPDAVPDVRPQQSVGIDDRAAKQAEAHV